MKISSLNMSNDIQEPYYDDFQSYTWSKKDTWGVLLEENNQLVMLELL